MTDSSRLKSTVYVTGLDNAVSDKILADTFLPFGEIVDVTIPRPELPSSTDPHRGFGYVEFEIPGDAKEAIDNMDQSELFGRVLKVAPAKPQKDGNQGLGSKTAVWESEGYLAKHAVTKEDQIAVGPRREELEAISEDPMHGLEGLDVAGPQRV